MSEGEKNDDGERVAALNLSIPQDSEDTPSSAHHPGPSTAAWLPEASSLLCQPPSPLKPPASLERPAGAKRDPARLGGDRERERDTYTEIEAEGPRGGEGDGHIRREQYRHKRQKCTRYTCRYTDRQKARERQGNIGAERHRDVDTAR